MKVARVNGQTFAIMDSAFGIGATAAMPGIVDLSDVDLTDGVSDGDLLVWDAASGTWIPGPGGSGSSLPWFNVVTDGTCVGDGVTDDTVALQAAIDTATASGTQSAWLYFPPGTYLIGGALQDTGAFNGQILLPDVDETTDEQITIRFTGAARPPFAYHGPGDPGDGGYSIIKSTLTGASGTAAVFSGGNGTFTFFTNVSVVVEDLICLTADNPTLSFWNLSRTQGGAIRDIVIATPSGYAGSTVQPTHSNAYGIKLPQKRDSNYTYVDGLGSFGMYTGILMGELAICRGVILALDMVGIEFGDLDEHLSLIVDMHATSVPSVLKATGTAHCDILSYDFETGTGPGWADIVYDLDDASNLLHGHVRYFGYPNPPTHTFTKNGGTNYSAAVIGPLTTTGRWELAVIPGSPPDSLYASGDWLYIFVP